MWAAFALRRAVEPWVRANAVLEDAQITVTKANRGLDLIVGPLVLFVWIAVIIVMRDLYYGETQSDVASQAVWKAYEAAMYCIACTAMEKLAPRLLGIKERMNREFMRAHVALAGAGRDWENLDKDMWKNVFLPKAIKGDAAKSTLLVDAVEVTEGDWFLAPAATAKGEAASVRKASSAAAQTESGARPAPQRREAPSCGPSSPAEAPQRTARSPYRREQSSNLDEKTGHHNDGGARYYAGPPIVVRSSHY